ncbi:hypothetical protein [Nocardioides albertanoniae]|uniref:hypothetical protein n=1 Tax=Nocardioides albertanoniae TaxID=1175486 RepID=UPI00114E7955|nr:hypothetical protein [Nocardioides albertanoniae]
MSTFSVPGPFGATLAVLSGLLSLGIGVVVLRLYHDEPFAIVWSSLPVVLGVIVLVSCFTLLLIKRPAVPPLPATDTVVDDERARFLPRRDRRGFGLNLLVFLILGGWFLVMGIVGAIEENWLWPVLAAFPAAYFLGFPALRAVGLFRPGGVWLTPTRILNEQYGLRTEIAVGDVETAYSSLDEVRVVPVDPSAVDHKRRIPRLWCARLVPGEMHILDGIDGGIEGLAAEIRERAVAISEAERPKRRWWGRG